MSRAHLVLAISALVVGGTFLHAARPGEAPSIGVIKGPSVEQAKADALDWFKQTNPDAARLQNFEAIWSTTAERSVLDRVAETFMLGDAEAQKLMTAARDGSAAAPVAAPDILKDAKRPAFFRANLGLAYAKQLSSRRVHEEALEVLKTIRPEQVVDPASYYFFKAVAEHKLQMKDDGLASVHRLLESIPDAPQRYLAVADLMRAEMETWKSDDLGHIARKMDNIERRLDLARGGPKTQNEQKEVIALLDKMIEDLEKQC